ncbi:MAG: glycoside hydrolase family 78 protein [Lachnospiraceae bacterium]|nr:glycoside hydrolase family 78 protein [Lachnospiraceae bacterium]
MKAIRLRAEYLNHPIGIDMQQPRLQWNCAGGIRQTAYQVVCKNEKGMTWDSSKVDTASMQAVYPYELTSREQIRWQVRLWDENDNPGDWSESSFEMGLLNSTDWKADWITGNYKVNKKQRYPVDCFRKKFTAPAGSARLYITACGLYEAAVNGKKVGDFVMAPGHTDYRKRVSYQTYDVTDLLCPGENTMEIRLADGWYRGSCGAWGLKNQYGTETKVIAQLEVDGKAVLYTDGTWDWSNDGPIMFADNKDGEVYDARKTPTYSGRAKKATHNVVPTASNNVPVVEREHFSPTVITTPGGKTVLDFGQNIAGYIAFSLEAKEGQKVFLRFGEILGSDGEFTQHNFQCSNKHITTPLQQIEYTCKEGENHYKTRFAVFGFRYVLLETEAVWKPEDFTAIAIYSDLEQTGFFTSSNPLLNQFVQNTIWSSKGNFLDVPTDCPTRERHGWTGDSQIFFSTASYLFDYAAFAQKHLRDIFDWQKKDGNLPQIAPDGGVDSYMVTMNGSPGWSDIGILLPYHFWKKYGDRRILEQYYEGMKKYAAFLRRRCGKITPLSKPLGMHREDRKYAVNCGQSYGEWAEPADVFPNKWTDMILPHPEVSTAYTAYCFRLFAEMAQEMGEDDTACEYKELSEKVKLSYQAMRRLPEFSLDTDRQAMLVRPLALDLLDEEQTAYAGKRLLSALEHYGWRLGTGFLSTPLILDVLTQIDPKAAYQLLENEEMPGWLYMPKSGATTVWENWEGDADQKGLGSMNHYSKGAVCEWLFSTMCGIRIVGENRFLIAPVPGGSFTCAKARYQSVYGMVESGWERENGRTVFHISVPANCQAKIVLPDGRKETVLAGSWDFACKET